MAWTEDQIRKCLSLWRADLKAMVEGGYIAPLPHPGITDGRRKFVKPLKPKRELVHNASGYKRGCRCETCREGWRAYLRDWKQRRRELELNGG
jgi:hypothetical protein